MNPTASILSEYRLARYLRNREVRVGLSLTIAMITLGALVPVISAYSPDRAAGGIPFMPPSFDHPFGTDNFGRDVMTRTFAAARLDLGLSLAGVAPSMILGTLIGSALGFTRSKAAGMVGTVAIESVNAFPFLVIAAAVLAVTGPGVPGVVLALAVTNWARYARLARARAIVVANSDYVDAARVLGYSRARILGRHVLPNVIDVSLSYAISDLVIVIIAAAGLSFLGLGVQPPDAEWGSMMASARLYLSRAWWMSVFPGLALTITAVGLNFIAEGIRAVQRDA